MNELLISLDTKSKASLYEQIYQFIRSEIQERQMLPGERLPSTRALSRNLQVSRSTVELAYDQLLSEGYIESLPYKGYYVCEIENLYEIPMPKQTSREVIQKKEKHPYDFAVSGIDPEGFPHNMWRKISKEVLQDESEELFSLGNPQGDYPMREAVVNYLHHARGVNCKPRQIVIGAGNDFLLMLLYVLLGSDQVVGMENPTYKSAGRVFENLGYEVAAIAMDQSGMDVESLESSAANIAYVMPAHQFPMGVVMPVKRRMQLLTWAAKQENRYIIEDDYDSEFRYRGKPIPALQGYDQKGKVIYMGTFSKSIAPAIRISYMVLPESLTDIYNKKGSAFSATVSRVDQKIIEVFLRKGFYERHLNRMRALYKSKHDLLISEIKKMTDICTVSGENAGVHIVVRLINGLDEQKAVELAERAGVKVYGVSEYLIEPGILSGAGNIIIGYAALNEAKIIEGISRLRKAWDIKTVADEKRDFP